MKMAKPSERDIDAAGDLMALLHQLDRGDYPNIDEDADVPDWFDEDNFEHLRAFYDAIKATLDKGPGYPGRVIGGMCYVIMYDKNEIVDPASDTLDLHPKIVKALEAVDAQAEQAAAVRAAEDEQEECWSADQENFNAMSLGELIDCNDELAPGMTVWVADAVRPSTKHLIDADDVIEQMGERAFDIARENAEDYPDVSDAEKAELDAILKSWIDRTCPPNFWRVKNVRPYLLSTDDFPSDTTPIEASFASPSTATSNDTGALGEKE